MFRRIAVIVFTICMISSTCFADMLRIPGHCGSGVCELADTTSATITLDDDKILEIAVCVTKWQKHYGYSSDGVWKFRRNKSNGKLIFTTSKDPNRYMRFDHPDREYSYNLELQFFNDIHYAAICNKE